MLSLFLGIPVSSQGGDDSSLSWGRQLVDRIDESHTALVDSVIKKYKKEICGGNHSEIDQGIFSKVKARAEILTNKCYAVSNLPRGVGIDFSSFQNLTEEVFFDSLLHMKMDHLTCRQYAVDCIENQKTKDDLTLDFIDRLTAYKIYRDKYKQFDSENGSSLSFSDKEIKILKKYFPGEFKSPQEFFQSWDPVTAISLIVNYTDPQKSRGFLFQETFGSLAASESELDKFGRMDRKKQIISIQQLIEKTSEGQKQSIADEKNFWERACRPEEKVAEEGSNCFYRPTYEQKRKLLTDFSLVSLFNRSPDPNAAEPITINNFGKAEKAFLCNLNARYGKGAEIFDAKMYNILTVFAFIPPVRALVGAAVTRNLSLSLMSGLAQKKLRLGHLAKGVESTGKFAMFYETSVAMKNLYDKCTSAKFTSKHALPYDESQKKNNKFKSRDQYLRDCQVCRSIPKAKQVFDRSCFKEATKWFLNRGMGQSSALSNAQLSTIILAQDKTGHTPITQKITDMSEALSMFFYNLSLTTSLEVPGLSYFEDELPQ